MRLDPKLEGARFEGVTGNGLGCSCFIGNVGSLLMCTVFVVQVAEGGKALLDNLDVGGILCFCG